MGFVRYIGCAWCSRSVVVFCRYESSPGVASEVYIGCAWLGSVAVFRRRKSSAFLICCGYR